MLPAVKHAIPIVLLSALVLENCDAWDCNLKNCTDRLEVRVIQSETEPTADGDYEMEFVWPGGGPRIISFVVGSGGGETGVSLLPDQGWPDWWGLERTEDSQVYINIAPFFVDELDTESVYESYVDSPVSVEIWVRSGEEVLGHETLFPEYERYWCNDDEGNCDSRRNFRSVVTMPVDYPPGDGGGR